MQRNKKSPPACHACITEACFSMWRSISWNYTAAARWALSGNISYCVPYSSANLLSHLSSSGFLSCIPASICVVLLSLRLCQEGKEKKSRQGSSSPTYYTRNPQRWWLTKASNMGKSTNTPHSNQSMPESSSVMLPLYIPDLKILTTFKTSRFWSPRLVQEPVSPAAESSQIKTSIQVCCTTTWTA